MNAKPGPPDWDAAGNPLTIDTVSLTYDALGRMVEQASGSTYTQIVYAPTGGKLALMTGQTLVKAFVALPGGATAVYNSAGLAYYRHSDWLGSSRLATTPSRAMYYDGAYAPYGENYAGSGTVEPNFTGQNQDTVTTSGGLYDFLFREYNPIHGRWPWPDPAGRAAVSIANPQSWNRYAYVLNNPGTFRDLLGLIPGLLGCAGAPRAFCNDGSGGGGGGGGSLPSMECRVDGYDVPCDLVYGLLQSGAAVDCTTTGCGPVPIPGAGFAFPSYAADGSINWSFSFEATSKGVQLTDAALAEMLGLPSNLPQGAANNGGPGSGTGGHTCQQNRILNAIPGATLTSYDVSQGGHEQIGVNTTGADLTAAGFSSFSLFGANGYRNSAVFWSVHCNGQYGAQLAAGGPFTNIQCHIDLFNPATGLFGILGHGIWDLGVGRLFFRHSAKLDPRC